MAETILDLPLRKRTRTLSPVELARLRKLVIDTSEKIARLPMTSIRLFAPILGEAEDITVRGLKKWLTAADPKTPFTMTEYNRALTHLEKAFEAISALGPELSDILTEPGLDAAAEAARITLTEFAHFRELFDGVIDPPSIDFVRAVGDAAQYVIPSFEQAGAAFAHNVGRDLQRRLAVGMVREETVEDVALRLADRKQLGAVGTAAAVIAGALFLRYEGWAARTITTQIDYAGSAITGRAVGQLALEQPDVMRRWDAVIDSRVCSTCRDLAGQTAPVGGMFYALGVGYDAPPAHPNCRCRVDAWMPRWDRYLEAIN